MSCDNTKLGHMFKINTRFCVLCHSVIPEQTIQTTLGEEE
jgi:hypothetical protein